MFVGCFLHQLSPPVDHHHSSSLSSLFFSHPCTRACLGSVRAFQAIRVRVQFVFCLLTDTEAFVVKPLAKSVAATHLKTRSSFSPEN